MIWCLRKNIKIGSVWKETGLNSIYVAPPELWGTGFLGFLLT
jgi:hypothetical protein